MVAPEIDVHEPRDVLRAVGLLLHLVVDAADERDLAGCDADVDGDADTDARALSSIGEQARTLIGVSVVL